MAYVPPHKRHSNDSSKPTPVPSSMIPPFNQALTLGGRSKPYSPRRHDRPPPYKVSYGSDSICRWFTAGSAGDDPIPPSVRLEPFDCEIFERQYGTKAMALKGGEDREIEESPWVRIAERIAPDLIHCYLIAIEDSKRIPPDLLKFNFFARTGKVLFFRNSVGLESLRKAAEAETDSRKQVHKTFYTNVSSACLEEIQGLIVPKIGFDFYSEKEHYRVMVSDKSNPESTISCKCMVSNDGEGLEIYKFRPGLQRYLGVDISCLYKDLDLRLMLDTKTIIKSLLDDEVIESTQELVKSAVIDPDVKGGLRWPLGKDSVADRFSVVKSWHIKSKTFKSQTTKIILRRADRFDRMTSIGEVYFEVDLKLAGISEHLMGGNVDQGLVKEMVQEAVKLIWDHFLNYNHPSA